MKRVYLSGIGGIGMANLAVLLKQGGYEVSGSDANIYEPAASLLRRSGIVPAIPYRPENVPRDGTPVVIGNALSRGHPEVEAALDAGIPVFSFPEFLYRNVLETRQRVVVAGTHGKSTTTACIAHILTECGREPGFLVGAQPLNFAAGASWGREEGWFVIEGDEYDSAFFDKRSKFLWYFPQTLVLGRVEFDHADIFNSLDDMLLSYTRLIRLLPQTGNLVYIADCGRARELAGRAPCRKVSVGSVREADWQLLSASDRLAFRGPDGHQRETPFALCGEHNRLNALVGVAAAVSMGLSVAEALTGLTTFRGLKRRLELLLQREDLVVYDDFAHHPTAVAGAIRAVRERHGGRHLIAVLEPRSNTMVRNIFQVDLAGALGIADEVVIGTIHRAERIPEGHRLDLERLRGVLWDAGVPCFCVTNPGIPELLADRVRGKCCAVLFMSNGGFDGVQPKFLSLLDNKH